MPNILDRIFSRFRQSPPPQKKPAETVILPEQKEFDQLKTHFNQTKVSLENSKSKTEEDILQLQKNREKLNLALNKMRGILSTLKTKPKNNSSEAQNLADQMAKEIRSYQSDAARLNKKVNTKTILVTGKDPTKQEQPYRTTEDESPRFCIK